jgi:hypothetical protein
MTRGFVRGAGGAAPPPAGCTQRSYLRRAHPVRRHDACGGGDEVRAGYQHGRRERHRLRTRRPAGACSEIVAQSLGSKGGRPW